MYLNNEKIPDIAKVTGAERACAVLPKYANAVPWLPCLLLSTNSTSLHLNPTQASPIPGASLPEASHSRFEYPSLVPRATRGLQKGLHFGCVGILIRK